MNKATVYMLKFPGSSEYREFYLTADADSELDAQSERIRILEELLGRWMTVHSKSDYTDLQHDTAAALEAK